MQSDVNRIRRGFEVFRCVCANCHSLTAFKVSDLTQLGYTLKQSVVVAGGGEKKTRKLSDYFVSPFSSSAQARRFNNGVVPPDLSLVLKQKSSHQIRRMLTGYRRD